MARMIEGDLNASGLRFAILVSRFNSFITDQLLEGALDALRRNGATDDDIVVLRVPGSWELPQGLKGMIEAPGPKPDAFIALGCVVRGGTDHHQFVGGEAIKGLAQIALEKGVIVSLGVLTVDSLDQAIERAGAKMGNKGADAALSAIEMANLLKAAGK
jgi:6,7-dimethyl-8-ribityllumazine synthase